MVQQTMVWLAARRIPMIRFRAGGAAASHAGAHHQAASTSHHAASDASGAPIVCTYIIYGWRYIRIRSILLTPSFFIIFSIRRMQLKIGNCRPGTNVKKLTTQKWNTSIEVDQNSESFVCCESKSSSSRIYHKIYLTRRPHRIYSSSTTI